jgi:hypothetical protein
MSENEFRDSLDGSTLCPGCGFEIPVSRDSWHVGASKDEPGEWVAVVVVQCCACPWKKAAAAGSSHKAHEAAQAIRSQLLRAIGV